MHKLILALLLSWFCATASAQVTIHKSTDLVVIRGKSFYLHTVEQGQTLYSICKAYGVDLETVKTLNDKHNNILSLYEVLRIPYVEPVTPKDENFYYHTVVKGETVYSIARKYGMKPKQLLKINSDYKQNTPLAIGAMIKIPRQVAESVLAQNKPAQTPAADTIRTTRRHKKGETHQPTREEEAPVFTHEPPAESERELPAHITEVTMPSDPSVKVALLLPFFSKDYPLLDDTLSYDLSVNITARSEQFIAFYEGMLLALDSLKNKGYSIDLRVYDTERNSEKMAEIARQLDQISPDLIIGPVHASVYKMLADQLQKNTIPLVYPLSSRNENLGQYPNFIQVNPPFATLAEKMAEWLRQESELANVIQINPGAYASEENSQVTNLLSEIPGISFFNWQEAAIPLDSLRQLLLPDRENILVLPAAKEAEVSSILPALSALTDGYRITVIGLPEWQTFTSVDHETYYKLNTKLFTHSYVDYVSPAALALRAKYRKYFHTEPHNLVFKAYDMGLYFIDLAYRFRDRTLEALEYYPAEGVFSRFRFEQLKDQEGKENHGFFIVNYGTDYQLKIQSL